MESQDEQVKVLVLVPQAVYSPSLTCHDVPARLSAMATTPEIHVQQEAEGKNLAPRFLAAMLVYISAVFSWTLYVYPLGRDYALLAFPEVLPWPTRFLVQLELNLFGTWLPGYHLVNLVLLYGCMVSLFYFTRYTVRGPWWMGSLAAVVMMANPLKSGAVLHITGAADLLPALLALLALLFYAWQAQYPRKRKLPMALAFLALATFPYERNALLFLVFPLIELLIVETGKRRWGRCVPFAVLGLCGLVIHRGLFNAAGLDPAGMFAPLFLAGYPIGLLPETAARFHLQPLLGWLSALAVLAVLALICRKARHPALVFGLIAAVILRLFQGNHEFDVVHLTGGGASLLPLAMLCLAFSSMCHRINQHPKWHPPLVFMTTVLCVLLFVLQGQENLAWRRAGQEIRAFQDLAKGTESPIGPWPDIQHMDGAPLALSKTVRHNTPFSKTLSTAFRGKLNCNHATYETILHASGGEWLYEGRPIDLLPAPYALGAIRATPPGEVAAIDTLDEYCRSGQYHVQFPEPGKDEKWGQ